MNTILSTRLYRAVQLHCFIMLISLPLLTAWGIPISSWSPIGNTLFTPILTLLIALTGLLWLATALMLPTITVAVIINTICSGWYTLLSYTPWDGLFAISACSAIINSILLLISIYTAYIAVRMPARTGAVWCLIITLSCYGLLYVRDLSRQGIIPLNNISPGLLLLYKSKITALIQYGPISNSAHNSSWVQYTLLPALIRESGAQKIQYLILTNLNRNSYALATQLIAHNIVKTIITVESPHAINPVALRWACNRAHIPYCHITRTHSIYKLTEQYIVKYT